MMLKNQEHISAGDNLAFNFTINQSKTVTMAKNMLKNGETKEKSLEAWLWDAACAIRGQKDAPKFKDYILPLVFVKRLCDVFDDEVERVAERLKTRARALQLIDRDHSLVRFYLPMRAKDVEQESTWAVIRLLTATDKASLGQQLSDIMRAIAKHNPRIEGIIDRIDFNATVSGQRELDDDSLSKLIEKISQKRLGLKDVEPDIIGRSYEYLIRKFAEGGGQSAGEFYTPKAVGLIMARILNPAPGMEVYDPTCGSAGLLIKCQLVLHEKLAAQGQTVAAAAPLKLYGQEFNPASWAMANMNMVIHDMEGDIQIGDTMNYPKFKNERGGLKTFALVASNPMWNQKTFTPSTYENDELDRFRAGLYPPNNTADWGWVLHILASLNPSTGSGQAGRAAIVLDTGAVSRGSGNAQTNKEKELRKWCVEQDVIEGVIYLPENLFYNTTAPGIILVLNKAKPPERQGKCFLLNASQEFLKGNPKNEISDEGQLKIAATFLNWQEIEKFSVIVSRAEIEKNDYNLSPSRYVSMADDETQRPIAELLEELQELNVEAQAIDAALADTFQKMGFEL